jgi:IS30 family transposase
VSDYRHTGDLVIGLQRLAIGTLVERSTRFTTLVNLPRVVADATSG